MKANNLFPITLSKNINLNLIESVDLRQTGFDAIKKGSFKS